MNETHGGETGRIDVAYVANLARLYLDDEEARGFQAQLADIVEYVRQIGRLDLEGIEPTSHANPVWNVFRRDEVQPSLAHETVMANAPVDRDGQFGVPPIMG